MPIDDNTSSHVVARETTDAPDPADQHAGIQMAAVNDPLIAARLAEMNRTAP